MGNIIFSCNWYYGSGLIFAHLYSYIQACLGKSASPVSWFPGVTFHHCLKDLWERPGSLGRPRSVGQAAIAGASYGQNDKPVLNICISGDNVHDNN